MYEVTLLQPSIGHHLSSSPGNLLVFTFLFWPMVSTFVDCNGQEWVHVFWSYLSPVGVHLKMTP